MISNTKTKSRKYFDELVYDYIREMYGKTNIKFSNNLDESNIEQFDSIFADLRKLHKEKQKYDLHRVFEYANKKFHYILQNILKTQFLPKIDILTKKLKAEHKSISYLEKDIKILQEITKHKEKVFKRKSQYFNMLSNIITIIDVIISVFLILLISEIAHYLNAIVSSWVL